MIRILATGSLHVDPVSRTAATGNPYTTAKLRAEGKDVASVWCSLIAFGAEAERLARLKAGAALSVSGRCEVSAWLNQEGEAKAGLSIVVDELITLKARPSERPPAKARPQEQRERFRRSAPTPAMADAPFDDDLSGLSA